MKAVRLIAIAFLWACAAWLINAECLQPLRCNAIEGEAETSTLSLISVAQPYSVPLLARQNLARVRPCLDHCPNVNMLMIAAENYRLLGRDEDAVRLYQRAMTLDRRPELFLNLGLAEINLGRSKEGIEHVVTACVYNPDMTNAVSMYHDEVQNRVSLYQLHIMDLQKRMSR